jgi:hypothetical protein
MAGAEDTGTPRPTDAKVDVLIIGSGASGAAVAWGLAETRMKILCLEQGDWIKPTDFPTNGPDWEARRYSDSHISPNRRARDTDYPVNSGSPPCSTDRIRIELDVVEVQGYAPLLALSGPQSGHLSPPSKPQLHYAHLVLPRGAVARRCEGGTGCGGLRTFTQEGTRAASELPPGPLGVPARSWLMYRGGNRSDPRAKAGPDAGNVRK